MANYQQPADSYHFYAQVRLVTPLEEGSVWSEIGLAYAKGLMNSWIPFRIVGATAGHIDGKSAWKDMADWFTTPYDDKRVSVNLVCGGNDVLDRYKTASIPYNIAITAAVHREHTAEELKVLQLYDEVWSPTWNHTSKLSKEIQFKCKLFTVNPRDSDALGEKMKELDRRFRRV